MGRAMKARLAIGVAALLCVSTAGADASTVWRIDFTSGRANGFFEIDPTNFVVPLTAAQPTTFTVVDADIDITDPGWLFGPIRFTLGNLLGTNCQPGECWLTFGGIQVVVPNFGTYHPALQLNFDKIWIDWVDADQQRIHMWFSQEAIPQNWNAIGDAQRTVESAAPVPLHSSWPLTILGLAGVGFMAYRRKVKTSFMAA
jgi:hypothetical protein